MKIERINENQIRCTLTRADLADRQLKLSELAYGSEKARSLFHDMMMQAATECGFEAENTPLMIEAIPSSADSITLIITKVEDPEELDTRFSKFAPMQGNAPGVSLPQDYPTVKLEGAEEIMNLIDRLRKKLNNEEDTASSGTSEGNVAADAPETGSKPSLRLFSFATLDAVIYAAGILSDMYSGANTLYKDHAEDVYVLAMTQSEHSNNEFNRICNMLTEYGSLENSTGTNLAYLEEHCEVILESDAVNKLAQL